MGAVLALPSATVLLTARRASDVTALGFTPHNTLFVPVAPLGDAAAMQLLWLVSKGVTVEGPESAPTVTEQRVVAWLAGVFGLDGCAAALVAAADHVRVTGMSFMAYRKLATQLLSVLGSNRVLHCPPVLLECLYEE